MYGGVCVCVGLGGWVGVGTGVVWVLNGCECRILTPSFTQKESKSFCYGSLLLTGSCCVVWIRHKAGSCHCVGHSSGFNFGFSQSTPPSSPGKLQPVVAPSPRIAKLPPPPLEDSPKPKNCDLCLCKFIPPCQSTRRSKQRVFGLFWVQPIVSNFAFQKTELSRIFCEKKFPHSNYWKGLIATITK